MWVGPQETITISVIEYLQKIFCNHNACSICIPCTQIKTQQHHSIQWFNPEKWYTLDQLKPLFSTLSYSLEPNAHYFFIVNDAHCLQAACANSLLKSIEEPPTGYHFILLTDQLDSVLPTIRSRCVIKTWYTTSINARHQNLFDCFVKKTNETAFATLLDKSSINERESTELFNQILEHWIKQYKNNSLVTSPSYNIISALRAYALLQPMPGSSKIFWRNLFLMITPYFDTMK